ncbi:hypothetical protein PI125_g8282 [Phytophthora idaei]|nr:hypothetical protein PI125_g8282 [Phytophthora idaei]KAG3159094.1 hypothetical protein PI126_g7569 [Phytophthora idaei]
MSTAWAVANEHVSTVLIGASCLSLLEKNVKGLNFVDRITPDVMTKIEVLVKFEPTVSRRDLYSLHHGRHL